MVRDHRGREWSVATKDCPNFLRQVLSTLGRSKNPEIQYFQKLPNKNFKVLLKRFLLGSYDLPGFLDFWIIIITWRDYETKSRGRGIICFYQLQSILSSVNATAAVTGAQRQGISRISWGFSIATKDCPNFLRQVLSTLGQSKNPEIH